MAESEVRAAYDRNVLSEWWCGEELGGGFAGKLLPLASGGAEPVEGEKEVEEKEEDEENGRDEQRGFGRTWREMRGLMREGSMFCGKEFGRGTPCGGIMMEFFFGFT